MKSTGSVRSACSTLGMCAGLLAFCSAPVGCDEPKPFAFKTEQPNARAAIAVADPSVAVASPPVTEMRGATTAVAADDAQDDELVADEWEPEAFLEPRTTAVDSPFGSCGGCGCWSP